MRLGAPSPDPAAHPNNQRPYRNRFNCRQCHQPVEVLDGILPPLCPHCSHCVFGMDCGGGHPPLISNIAPDYSFETYSFLARTIRRLVKGRVCRWQEVTNFPTYVMRHN